MNMDRERELERLRAELASRRPEWVPRVAQNARASESPPGWRLGNISGAAGKSLVIYRDPEHRTHIDFNGNQWKGDDLDLIRALCHRPDFPSTVEHAAALIGFRLEAYTKNGHSGGNVVSLCSSNHKGNGADKGHAGKAKDPQAEWFAIAPVPEGVQVEFPYHHLGGPSATFEYCDAGGDLLMIACRFNYVEGGKPAKEFYPLSYCRCVKAGWNKVDDNGKGKGKVWKVDDLAWRWKALPVPRPLYGLDRLASLEETFAPVLIVEGEKKADRVCELFPDHVGVSVQGGAQGVGKADLSPLKGRDVVIWRDNDAAGKDFEIKLVERLKDGITTTVRAVRIPDGFPSRWDIADEPPQGWTVETLRDLLESAGPPSSDEPPPTGKPDRAAIDEDAEIERLSKLPLGEYDRQRETAAQSLGYRVGTLDKLVKAKQAEHEDKSGAQGHKVTFEEIEPWPHEIVGESLFDELTGFILKCITTTELNAEAVALWIVGTYVFDSFGIFPRLIVTSPEKGCGKSSLLDVLSLLVPKPQLASNTTCSPLFRVIHSHRPTILLDECDTYLKNNPEMVGIINSGHKRNATVLRSVGETFETGQFMVWAPMAIAGIGRTAGTIEARSIIISMRRRHLDEPFEMFSLTDPEILATVLQIRRQASRWAADHVEALRSSRPVMPRTVFNRDADNWRPLVAIADAAGGKWPALVRSIAETIVAAATGSDSSYGVMALVDIRDLFDGRGVDRFFSDVLVRALVDLEGRPWAEFGKAGKPLTKNRLARLLAPYGIAPSSIYIEGETAKGYRRPQFEEAFATYLTTPPNQNVRTSEGAENKGFQPRSETSGLFGSDVLKPSGEPQKIRGSDVLTVQKAGNGHGRAYDGPDEAEEPRFDDGHPLDESPDIDRLPDGPDGLGGDAAEGDRWEVG